MCRRILTLVVGLAYVSFSYAEGHCRVIKPGPQCVPKDCPSLSAPSHGALNTSDTAIGTCVSVTCEEGCTSIGPPELTCGSDGHWDPQEMPECVEIRRDCQDLRSEGHDVSDVFTIRPCDTCDEMDVYCEMDTDGGGWIVFQHREDGSVDFYRGWSDYKNGFGDLAGEHWLGLEKLHTILLQGDYLLRVNLEDFTGEQRYAEYGTFDVAGADEMYTLTVDGYLGTAGDSLKFHSNGRMFSTHDQDNDRSSSTNCAEKYAGAWWYNACHKSNLNGLYLSGQHNSYANGINWHSWKGYHYSLKTTWMMIRLKPTECPSLTAPLNGGISCTGVVPGSVCTATCDPSFILIGAETITCQDTMRWDFPVPSCSEGHTRRDCKDRLDEGSPESAVYTVRPCDICPEIQAHCDMQVDGGGWMVFQQRKDGSEDFYRTWEDYRVGFGSLLGERWLGNDLLHMICTRESCEMRVELEDHDGNKVYAKYDSFQVADATDYYRLSLGSYSGTAGDSMTGTAGGQQFSTRDKDNDKNTGGSCAQLYKGGWWYNSCHKSNLNGLYHNGDHTSYADGVNWYTWKGYKYSMKSARMMIRRVAPKIV